MLMILVPDVFNSQIVDPKYPLTAIGFYSFFFASAYFLHPGLRIVIIVYAMLSHARRSRLRALKFCFEWLLMSVFFPFLSLWNINSGLTVLDGLHSGTDRL